MTNKITYTQQGDYLLPDLKLPEQPKVKIGIWGCGSPVETSAAGRSTDRADRRDSDIWNISNIAAQSYIQTCWQAHRLPRRHWWAGKGAILSVGKTTCRKGRCDWAAQSGKSNAVGRRSPVETSAAGRSADRADRRDSEWTISVTVQRRLLMQSWFMYNIIERRWMIHLRSIIFLFVHNLF